jgi:hypothetical protein
MSGSNIFAMRAATSQALFTHIQYGAIVPAIMEGIKHDKILGPTE